MGTDEIGPGSASSTRAAGFPTTSPAWQPRPSASPASTAATSAVVRSRDRRPAPDRLADRHHQPQGHPLGRRPADRAAARVRLGQGQGRSPPRPAILNARRLPGLPRRHLRRRRRRHRQRQGPPVALLRALDGDLERLSGRRQAGRRASCTPSATSSSTRSSSTTWAARTLTNVVVKDTLPSGVTFISAMPAAEQRPQPADLECRHATAQPEVRGHRDRQGDRVRLSRQLSGSRHRTKERRTACDTTVGGTIPFLVPTKSVYADQRRARRHCSVHHRGQEHRQRPLQQSHRDQRDAGSGLHLCQQGQRDGQRGQRHRLHHRQRHQPDQPDLHGSGRHQRRPELGAQVHGPGRADRSIRLLLQLL